jgi:hypothetical protein
MHGSCIGCNSPRFKPYKLISQALQRTSKVAIIKMAWHGKERLGQLRVVDDGTIALQAMYWPDEVRSPAELAQWVWAPLGDRSGMICQCVWPHPRVAVCDCRGV